MGWLDRIRKAISGVLFRIAVRTEPRDGAVELIRREREHLEERERARIELKVWPMEEMELRPFSSVIQYSDRTKVRRDLRTGKFVSKTNYKRLLAGWRQETAGEYIHLAHPDWTERELALAVMRLEEIRSKPATSWMDDIEIGELFTP